jgi:hypothetical protein
MLVASMEAGLVENYKVYGIDENGTRHLVADTASAKKARAVFNSGDSPWVKSVVFGADGELTAAEIDHLVDLEDRIA